METKHHGSCHCGNIKFTARVDLARVSRCNCTICTKLAVLGTLTTPDKIELVSGTPAVYAWASKVAKRYFCATCGTHCYSTGFLAELGGAFAGVNVNALDDVDPNQLRPIHWDGRHDNWEAGPSDTPWPIFTEHAA